LRSHEYLRLVYEARDLQGVRPAMALREELMYEHIRDAIDAAPGERLVLMGHDFHLARDDQAIRSPAGAIGPGGDQVPSIGARLHSQHAGEILAVWMLEGGGRDASPVEGGGATIKARRGSLNALLSEVGEAFVLPLHSEDPRAAPLRAELPLAVFGGTVVRTPIAEQADVLAFVRDVSPLRARAAGSR
jgi:erythromycin esterase-like protein